MSWKKVIWACDPIGSFLFIVATTLTLLALDWAGGVYPWHDKHVVAPLTIGLICLVAFAIYGQSFAGIIGLLELTVYQNGRAEMTAWWHTSSSEMGQTSHFQCSLLLLKAGSSIVQSTASLL